MFLSRDRFGKKPLYYFLKNGTFAFSSELKSLIQHTNSPSSVSSLSLRKYFAYGFIPAPNALFEGVYKLPAGHNLELNVKTLNYAVKKFWDFVLEPFEKIPEKAENVWGEELRDLLSKAVERRLMSDVPLGVFLSGGIDSSAITAFAAQYIGGNKLKTFSIGFKEDSFDESVYSQKVASLLGTDHHLTILSSETAKNALPEITEKIDEPMGDGSLIPTYLLCGETRKHVTVAIGGDGADELFAGYDPFHALKAAELYNSLVPKPVHKAIRLIADRLPVSFKNMSFDFKIKRTLKGISYPKKIWNPVWLGPLDVKELEELFSDPINSEELYSEAIQHWDDCHQKNLIDKTLQFLYKDVSSRCDPGKS